jgi:hypothetical protein
VGSRSLPPSLRGGVLMLGCGAGLLFRATAVWTARILFPYLVIWVLLKVPVPFAAPGMEAVWLYPKQMYFIIPLYR